MNNTVAQFPPISRRGLVGAALSATALSATALAASALSAAASDAEECRAGRSKPDDAAQPASWVSALALQAATYAMPIVAMYNLRDSTSVGPHAKVPPNEIWRIEDIASPQIAEQAGYATPNVNVIYGFGFMDLGSEPYPGRAIVAVFGLTSNTPEKAIYYTSVTDGRGQKLTGAKRYTLTFKASMPCIKAVAPGFWSITAYDSATGYTIPNPINRYALGGDDQLKRNADGSLTLYV